MHMCVWGVLFGGVGQKGGRGRGGGGGCFVFLSCFDFFSSFDRFFSMERSHCDMIDLLINLDVIYHV